MDERNRHTGGQGSWIRALGTGIVVCLLTGFLLDIAVIMCLPGIVDGGPRVSNVLLGIVIWLVSIGAGVLQVVRCCPRK